MIELFIMQYSPLPCCLVPLKPKHSPQHPILKHSHAVSDYYSKCLPASQMVDTLLSWRRSAWHFVTRRSLANTRRTLHYIKWQFSASQINHNSPRSFLTVLKTKRLYVTSRRDSLPPNSS